MLYHGTPDEIDILEERKSWCVAAYTTPAPGLAALYAGAQGLVYAYAVDEGANVLIADGDSTVGFNYLTEKQIYSLMVACDAVKVDLHGIMRSVDQNAPPRQGGILCWEEFIRFPITPVRRTKILKALGYDGIRYRESALGVQGDFIKRGATFQEPFLSLHDSELGASPLDVKAPVSVAMFRPQLLTQIGDPVPAKDLAGWLLDDTWSSGDEFWRSKDTEINLVGPSGP